MSAITTSPQTLPTTQLPETSQSVLTAGARRAEHIQRMNDLPAAARAARVATHVALTYGRARSEAMLSTQWGYAQHAVEEDAFSH